MEPPTTPSPFNPQRPRPATGGPSRAKPLLIGCGVLLLLLGIAAVVLVAKQAQLVGWVYSRLEAQITAKLPPDVTPEERQRLSQAFDAATEAIGSGKVDPAKANQLNFDVLELAQGSRQLTREDVLKLTRTLEEAAGKNQAEPGV
jgi:hypothetical protein